MADLLGPLPDYLIRASRELPRNIPRLRSADMVMCDPDIEYLVQDIMPAQGVAAVYGPPASGKSFLAMDLAFHLACHRSAWFCTPIRPVGVIYVALEGQGGLKKRMKAWQRHNAVDLAEGVQVWDDPFRLDDPNHIEALAQEAMAAFGKGCVIVIDTLAQAMAGYDENSSAEMGSAIAGAQRLSSIIAGLVILIHHSGKDPTKGMRGHSSLLGALDASIEVISKVGGRCWKVRKSKDGEAGQEYDFDLVPYTVGTDRNGQPITSCAVRQTIHSPSSKLGTVKGAHRIAVMAALVPLLGGGAQMAIELATAAAAPDIEVETKRQRAVARSTILSLIASGHLTRNGDSVCLPA